MKGGICEGDQTVVGFAEEREFESLWKTESLPDYGSGTFKKLADGEQGFDCYSNSCSSLRDRLLGNFLTEIW